MKIKECIQLLEQWANPMLAESYDNCGLIVGNSNTEITSALITLDCTEEVVEEAISKNCNLIIAHHPIVFSGLKKIVGKNYVERTVLKAIKNDIAMTGEIELTGRITKIGGLHFKLLGAKKAGVKIVYVPKENTNDIDDIKIKYPSLFDNLEIFNIKFFEYIDEIIDDILV
jgi:hypothetical protein